MFSEVSGKGKSISPTINGILGLYSRSHYESNASYFINLNDKPFKFKNNIFASAEILVLLVGYCYNLNRKRNFTLESNLESKQNLRFN